MIQCYDGDGVKPRIHEVVVTGVVTDISRRRISPTRFMSRIKITAVDRDQADLIVGSYLRSPMDRLVILTALALQTGGSVTEVRNIFHEATISSAVRNGRGLILKVHHTGKSEHIARIGAQSLQAFKVTFAP